MTRRTAIALAAGAIVGRSEVSYRTYARCMPDYLARLAAEARMTRDVALSTLTTRGAIEARQAWVRSTFWNLIGGRPETTPLNVQTRGAFDRPAYRVEKLTYESQPGLVIPANLYVPKNIQPPFPGVLFQMGHSLNGKAAEPYQKCCQALAQLGYLVLAFDPMGQGERTYYPRPNNGVLTRLDSADAEHTVPGKQMLLVGDTATRMQAWDAVRSLDVLASHPLVDPERMASTGQSGGGTLTMFLMAVDDRLAAAAISSGNTENFANESFNSPGSVDDAEQNFINAGPAGFDRWDLLYPMAPKPMLVSVSARDFFGTYSPVYIENGRLEFNRLKNVYEALGAGDKLSWYETPLPHALSHDVRVQIYSFFESTFRGKKGPVAEPPVQPETDEQLTVGPSGNVVRDYASKTPLKLAQERAATLKRTKPAKFLNVRMPNRDTRPKVVGTATGEAGPIQAIEVQVEREVFLPAYLFLPKGEPKSVIIPLDPRGRNGQWKEGDLFSMLAAAGHAVAAFDIRAIGDLWPEVGRGNPFYTRRHAEEDSYAWASLMLGKSLLTQRVEDILAIVQSMRNHVPVQKARIVLAGAGHLAVPVTFAGALDSGIPVVYTTRALKSYASLLEQEQYSEPFANFIPNVLASFDLPDVRAELGPRLKQGTAWDVATFTSL
jgi:dienelactone hydrolase